MAAHNVPPVSIIPPTEVIIRQPQGNQELTLNIRQRRLPGLQHPVPPVRQQGRLHKGKRVPHRRHRLGPRRVNRLGTPLASRKVLPVLLELLVLDDRRVRRDQLRAAHEDARLDLPRLQQPLHRALLRLRRPELALGEQGLQLAQDQPRVAVDVLADGAQRDAPVPDAQRLCEVGPGQDGRLFLRRDDCQQLYC